MKKIAQRTVNKREESTKEYMDVLQEKYSKLNVVRVDLAYEKPYSDDVTLDEVNRHLKKITSDTRSKPSIFKAKVGYIIKKEYTEDKGMHIHAAILFDGQKVKNDVLKAIEIGKYWNESVTNKIGSYHNCNLDANKIYGEQNAVGMLDHSDIEKRKKLDSAISYLCKDEQSIESMKSSKQDRAFLRGTMPKRKSNKGRPRKSKD